VIVNEGRPDERHLLKVNALRLEPGSMFRLETGGGGGFGNALEREPERVREDVLDGYVTLEGAERDYGVVLDPETLDLVRVEGRAVEWRPGVRTRFAEPSADGGLVFEQWCDPDRGAPTHTHLEAEEVITVVAGTADFWIENEHMSLGEGGSIRLPPHSWHGFRNTGDTELHIVAAFDAAAPPVQYRDEHEQRVLQIGGSGEPVDAHRSVREA
jgi:mannose-6-phosphate isomerase-like protein (cupin superfamily)